MKNLKKLLTCKLRHLKDYLIRVNYQSIVQKREALKIRLENLQNKCPHAHKEIGLYSWRLGCVDDAYFCKHCGKMLGYVTKYPTMN